MNRVRIVYDVEGWAYAHRAAALRKFAPDEFHVTAGPLRRTDGRMDVDGAIGDRPMDVLFTMMNAAGPPRLLCEAARRRGWTPRHVGAWNAGWPTHVELFPERYDEADLLIVNNAIAWDGLGRLARTVCCPNGVDLDVFHVTTPVEGRRPMVLWVGSELQRDLKGYDEYLVPLQRRLTSLGIASDFHLVDSFGGGKRSQQEMAAWYNGGTILVCASETEGTPNPALEAAACGCVPVSTRVGTLVELVRNGENGYLVERSVDGLLAGVLAAIERYPALARQLQRDISNWSWKVRSQDYYDVFRRVLESGNGANRGPSSPRA
jgi:glycosyltransferase involved in cell wall biosynthesis